MAGNAALDARLRIAHAVAHRRLTLCLEQRRVDAAHFGTRPQAGSLRFGTRYCRQRRRVTPGAQDQRRDGKRDNAERERRDMAPKQARSCGIARHSPSPIWM
jgi:hypothetical protein